MNNTPIFAHKVKIDRPWVPHATVADTLKRHGFVPPSQAAQQPQERRTEQENVGR